MLEETKNEDATLLGRIMVDEADRIDSIVNDFLQMSRQKPPQPEAVYLPTMFGELERLCRRDEIIAEVDVVSWDVSESCPRCHADRDQLKQILLNLVRNSAEALAGQQQKIIAISAHDNSASQTIDIKIVDNGPGIPEQDRSRVMQPFYSTKAQGTGLGLALVQRMVYAHGGTMTLSSENPGLAVTITLPMSIESVGD